MHKRRLSISLACSVCFIAVVAGCGGSGGSGDRRDGAADLVVPASDGARGDGARTDDAGDASQREDRPNPSDGGFDGAVGSDASAPPDGASFDVAQERPADARADTGLGDDAPAGTVRDASADLSTVDAPEDQVVDASSLDTSVDTLLDRPTIVDALHGDGAVIAPRLAAACAGDGWCWSNPQPQGEQLDVWAASATDAWGVGPLGLIRHFDGNSWSTVASGIMDNFFGVWGAAANDIWAVGAKGSVVHGNGSTWTPATPLTTGTLFCVRGRSANDVWIGAQAGELFHYDGSQWTKTPSGLTSTIEDLWETSDGTVFLLGQLSGAVMRRRPGETAFSHIDYRPEAGTPSLDHLWASGPNDLWATGVSGVLRHDGTRWSPVELGAGYVMTVRGSAANDVWLLGDAGLALHYDGAKFERWDTGTVQPLDRAFARAPDDVWVTGWEGGLIRLQPTGATRYTAGFESHALFAGWASGPDDVLALGADGFMGRYHAATGWQPMTSNTKFTLHAAWGTGPDDIWAVGDSGVNLHWLGSSWTPVSSGTLSDLYAVWGAAPDDVWAVGGGGAIQRWNGTRWSTAATASSTVWRGVWGAAANDVWLVGNIGETWHWNGTTFTKTTTTNSGGVWGRSATEVYGWGQSKVTRWNGTKWLDLALPSPTLGLSLSLSVGGGPSGDIWAVSNGEVLRFDGAGWSPPRALIYSYLESVVITSTDAWVFGGRDQVLRRPL